MTGYSQWQIIAMMKASALSSGTYPTLRVKEARPGNTGNWISMRLFYL